MAYAWIDGNLVNPEGARVPLTSRGLLYGDGCFETIRIHNAAPFRFEEHIKRLWSGLEVLRISSPYSQEGLREGSRALVEAQDLKEGLLRITITAGEDEVAGTAAISSRALPAIPQRVVLHVSASARRMPGPLSQCKTIARAAESLALREARAEGAFDSILLNPAGRVVETSSRNIFAVSDGNLHTPSLAEGALPGITRATILAIAATRETSIRQTRMTANWLKHADEVFLAGTGVGVLGVSAIDDSILSKAPGPITQAIAEGYRSMIDAESKW